MIQMRLVKPGLLKKEEVPTPEPAGGQVLIRVAWCGVCGSDVHAFEGKHPFITTPIVQGHEFSGTVHALGPGVEGLKRGERVTVEPSIVCGKCFSCTHGRYNICRNLRVLGCQAPGAFAEFVLAPAAKLFRLPDGLSLKCAALVEPLAVGVHAVRRGGLAPRENAVVIGAGTIGLMTMMAAKSAGAAVMQTDVLDYRLGLAETLGAAGTCNPMREDSEKELRRLFAERGADVIFECAGSRKSIEQAFRLAQKGTRLVMTAVYTSDAQIPMGIVQDWEIELAGTLMYMKEDYETAIRLLQEGVAQAEALITHELPLQGLPEAYRLILDRDREKVKVLIKVAGE